jgi:hypothetical protein
MPTTFGITIAPQRRAVAFAPVVLPAEAHRTGGPAARVCDFEIRGVTRCVILRAPCVALTDTEPGVHVTLLCGALGARTALLLIDMRLSARPGRHENDCSNEDHKRCEHCATSIGNIISHLILPALI